VDPSYSILDTPALWALAVGFITPPIVSVLQEQKWSERTKALVAFGFYLLIAAVTAYFAGLWTVPDVGRLWLLIFLSASTSYRNFWKPTGVSPAIEKATSSTAPAESPPRA
jgi:hypothetical protein